MENAPDTSAINVPAHVRHARLHAWVAEIAILTQPDRVYWADGSQAEYEHLCEAMVQAGTLTRLTALGLTPRYEDIEWGGCAVTAKQFETLTRIERREWQQELNLHAMWLNELGERVPPAISLRYELLRARITDAVT